MIFTKNQPKTVKALLKEENVVLGSFLSLKLDMSTDAYMVPDWQIVCCFLGLQHLQLQSFLRWDGCLGVNSEDLDTIKQASCVVLLVELSE